MSVVSVTFEDGIAVVTASNPPVNTIDAKVREGLSQAVGEIDGVAPARLDELRHDAVGQQAGVLGEQAEENAVQEVRHRLRGMPARLQRLRDQREAARCCAGHLVRRLLWT